MIAATAAAVPATAWYPWDTAPRDARIDAWHRRGFRLVSVFWDQELARWIAPDYYLGQLGANDLTHWTWPPRGPNGEVSKR